jgi:hypothetical protein
MCIKTTTCCIFLSVEPSEPLATLDPADRPAAKAETSAAAAFAWLADPQPPPPPLELHQQIAREIAEVEVSSYEGSNNDFS